MRFSQLLTTNLKWVLGLGCGLLMAVAVPAGDPHAATYAHDPDDPNPDYFVRFPLQPLEPTVIEVPEALGPPGLSCKQALARVPKKPRPAVSREPRPDPRLFNTYGVDRVVIDGRAYKVSELPGLHPEQVPLQPLEGDTQTLARIAAVVTRAEAGGAVRFSFFGGSHTEGDFWTGRIRRVLQDRYGDRGHGFIMPAAPVAGYRGDDISLCRTSDWVADWSGKRKGRQDGLLGFAGMSVSSGDSQQFGWVETSRSGALGRSTSLVDVYTLGLPAGGTLRIQIDDTEWILVPTAAPEPVLRRHQFRVPDGPHRIVLSPRGDGEVRVVGVSLERDRPGIIVDAMGLRGRTAKTWLTWNRRHATQGLVTLNPDLVVLAYGTNEASDSNYTMSSYSQDLRQVLTEMRLSLPDAACILAGPSDRGVRINRSTYKVWKRTQAVSAVQREVAAEFQCAFWDWQRASGGPGAMIGSYFATPKLAARDLIHHSVSGYRRQADRFIAALDQVAADPDLQELGRALVTRWPQNDRPTLPRPDATIPAVRAWQVMPDD